MDAEVSCFHSSEIIRWFGRQGVPAERLLEGIVDNERFLIDDKHGNTVPVTKAFLLRKGNWVSNELSLQLFRNAAEIIGKERPLFLLGHEIFNSRMTGLLGWALRLTALNPQRLSGWVEVRGAKLNRTKRSEIPHFDSDSGMTLRVAFVDDTVEKSPLACDYNEGGIVGLASLWGKDVRSKTVKCVCAGDPYCEYELTWKKRGSLQTLFRVTSRGYQLIQDDLEAAEGG